MAQCKLIFLLFLSTVSTAAWSGEQVDRKMAADEVRSVFIENVRGQFEVIGWDKPQIHLSGELDDAAKGLIFRSKGKKALIKVEMKGKNHRGLGSNLKVYLPEQIKLRFKGVDTNFLVSNIAGKVEGKTIKGDLVLKNLQGSLRFSSVSGKVWLSQSQGVAKIESVNGAVNLAGQYEYAKIKSMSGKVSAKIDEIDKLKVKNVSGETMVSGTLREDADIELNSVTGDIKYVSGGNFNGECEVATQFGGVIENHLTEDQPWQEKLQQRKLKFVSGKGSGKLEMKTVSGNVTLDDGV